MLEILYKIYFICFYTMATINFIFDNFYNGIPIPNGISVEDFKTKLTNEPFKSEIQQIKESDLKSNYNETFNHCYFENDVYYIFRYNNILVKASNTIDDNCLNFYLVMPRNHLHDVDDYLDLYQTKLEKGLNVLFITPHEMGDYIIFKEWVNNNPYKNNIYIISPSYNMRKFYECRSVFFPFFLFNSSKDFKLNAENPEWNVCTKEQYINTQKKKLFVSWNRNVRRMHRLLFYEFLKEQNQLDNNYVSFLEFPPTDYYINSLDTPQFVNKKYLENYINGNGGVRYDIDLMNVELSEIQNKLTNRFNVPEVYSNSYFTIVTETNYFENQAIITEKILRPLANFHPFIIIGPAGIYKELEKFGYKIPNLINHERIDAILNPHIRLKETFEEIKNLINNFNYDKNFVTLHSEVLEHNQNLLLNFKTNDAFYFMYNKLIKTLPKTTLI